MLSGHAASLGLPLCSRQCPCMYTACTIIINVSKKCMYRYYIIKWWADTFYNFYIAHRMPLPVCNRLAQIRLSICMSHSPECCWHPWCRYISGMRHPMVTLPTVAKRTGMPCLTRGWQTLGHCHLQCVANCTVTTVRHRPPDIACGSELHGAIISFMSVQLGLSPAPYEEGVACYRCYTSTKEGRGGGSELQFGSSWVWFIC